MRNACPAYGKTCLYCKKKNHFSSVCFSKSSAIHSMESDHVNVSNDPMLYVTEINSVDNVTQQISINGKCLTMQHDTGASTSIISSSQWIDINKPTLKKSSKTLEAYDGHRFTVLGEFTEAIAVNGKFKLAVFTVVQSDKRFGLLGRDLLDENLHHIDSLSEQSVEGYPQ